MTDHEASNHTAFREALGGYVLGMLDAAERADVAMHLEGCPACAEELLRLAPLPGLLSRSATEGLGGATQREDAVPGSLLASVARSRRSERRAVLAWRVLAVGSAAVAIAVGALSLSAGAPGRAPTRPPRRPGRPVPLPPARPLSWCRLRRRCPPGDRCGRSRRRGDPRPRRGAGTCHAGAGGPAPAGRDRDLLRPQHCRGTGQTCCRRRPLSTFGRLQGPARSPDHGAGGAATRPHRPISAAS